MTAPRLRCGFRGRRLRGWATVGAAAETYLARYPRARTAIEAADSPTFVRVAGLESND